MKTIDTLVHDIHAVLERKGHNLWTLLQSHQFSQEMFALAEERFRLEPRSYSHIGMSSIGSECKRKLWFKNRATTLETNAKSNATAEDQLQFFIGDIVEATILNLAEVAGHTVEGRQDTLEYAGFVGHRDAVIDGVTVDVKSASVPSYLKFVRDGIRSNDSFGYVSQLSSYVKAAENDPLVTDKTRGAFLVYNKVTGRLFLDVLDLSEELKNKDQELHEFKAMLRADTPPERLDPVPQNNKLPEGNQKLCLACSNCDRYRDECWPNARAFQYSDGITYLTEVVKTPRVNEIPKLPF